MEFSMFAAFIWAFQLNTVVQVNAQASLFKEHPINITDAPRDCGFNIMSPEMRQTVLDGHNGRRSLLARGQVKKNKYCTKTFPPAANMLRMRYACEMEKKAYDLELCKRIPPREAFRLRARNFYYVNTPIVRFKPVKSPTDALLEAMRYWWSTHLYHHGLHGLVVRRSDYPALPFLMMANAKTPGVGCAVDLCHYDNDKGLYARHKYYAVVCLYKKPHVKLCKPFYEKGRPCSHCPCGTRCQKRTKLCKKILT